MRDEAPLIVSLPLCGIAGEDAHVPRGCSQSAQEWLHHIEQATSETSLFVYTHSHIFPYNTHFLLPKCIKSVNLCEMPPPNSQAFYFFFIVLHLY